MSTPDNIRARARGGQQIGGPYYEGSNDTVFVYKDAAGAVYFESGMSIDCDGQPGSACNINTDPYFQPNTAWNQSNGQPLKAEELPFVVIPLKSSRWDYTQAGIRGGDLCVMAYRDKYVFGVVGDLGPTARIGEGSYAAAAALGVNPNPRSGGVGSGVTYVVFPGVRVSPIESKAEAVRIGTAKLAEWLGLDTVPGEEPPVTTPVDAIDKMVAEAEKTLGLGEPNYIQTWYNDKFGNPDGSRNWPWCNGAVTYWAHKSGNAKAVCFSDNGHFAYTVAHADAFKARGQWNVDVAGIRRGDIVFFDWDGSNNISAIDHVGLVVDVKGSEVHTIEGNIENACRRKVRNASTIAGYGRPNYSTTGGGTPVPTTVKLADAIAKTAGATRVIQDALNREFGGVVVDGDYGPKTTAAYTRWQKSLGWPGDGVPGAHSLWALAKKYGFSTDITGTPAGPGTPPTTPPEVPTVPVIKLGDAGPRGTVAANKVVQTALNKWKPALALLVDGIFGAKTSAAYKQWQESLYGPGPDSDGVPGFSSLSTLGARAAYRFQVEKGVTPPVVVPPVVVPPVGGSDNVADYLTRPEPAMDMGRTTYGGRTVNRRTAALLKLAAGYAGVSINLTQGSYNAGGVAASAGTHDGGGVVDISVNSWSAATRTKVVVALRKAGFAAWLRTPAQGFSYHIHACAIGDREMSSGAKNQVRAYFNGRNGLANNGADDAERRWPNWADRYK